MSCDGLVIYPACMMHECLFVFFCLAPVIMQISPQINVYLILFSDTKCFPAFNHSYSHLFIQTRLHSPHRAWELHMWGRPRLDQRLNLDKFPVGIWRQLRTRQRRERERGGRGDGRRRRQSFSEWGLRLCVVLIPSSPLCVKFSGSLSRSLVISLRWRIGRWGGRVGGCRERAGLGERGISLTKSVSTTKRRLYQIPLIPTQRCHTHHSPALNCRVKKKCPHLSKAHIFCQQALIEIPLIFPPPSQIFENSEILMLISKIGL